jgi:hypothetical protein
VQAAAQIRPEQQRTVSRQSVEFAGKRQSVRAAIPAARAGSGLTSAGESVAREIDRWPARGLSPMNN